MTHLSFGDFCWLITQLYPEKGGSLFFIIKNLETLDKTEFKSINI